MLDFTLPAVDGGQIRGRDYSGKALALWFWAPWCTVCNGEAPGVVRLARRYDGKVTFLGVAGRDGVGPMREFVQKYGVPFPSVADTELAVWRQARVRGQPAWVFVQPDGTAELFYRPDDATVQAKLAALARD